MTDCPVILSTKSLRVNTGTRKRDGVAAWMADAADHQLHSETGLLVHVVVTAEHHGQPELGAGDVIDAAGQAFSRPGWSPWTLVKVTGSERRACTASSW